MILKKENENPLTRIERENTKKQKPPTWIEKQNTENWNTTHTSITKQILTQKDKINVDLIKNIMTEKKTTLPSLRNQDWEKSR